MACVHIGLNTDWQLLGLSCMGGSKSLASVVHSGRSSYGLRCFDSLRSTQALL